MSNYFDYIISLGNDCSVAGSLRKLKFKEASYPFDWILSNPYFTRVAPSARDPAINQTSSCA